MTRIISTRELQRLRSSGESFALVDVSSQAEFDDDHIADSTNIPVDAPDFVERIERHTEGNLHERIVVYCAGEDCDASTRAARKLSDAGYSNVEDYRAGMQDWIIARRIEAGFSSKRVARDPRLRVRAREGAVAGSSAMHVRAEEGASSAVGELASGRGTPDRPAPLEGEESREDRGDNTLPRIPRREIGSTPAEPARTNITSDPDGLPTRTLPGESSGIESPRQGTLG